MAAMHRPATSPPSPEAALALHVQILRLPKPGRARCEDIAGGIDRTWWLLDGATGVNAPDEACDSGWFAEAVQAAFLTQLAAHPNVPLDVMVAQASQIVEQTFLQRASTAVRERVEWWPSSTMVLARINPGQLEALVLGDSDLAVVSADGNVRTIRDQRHNDFCAGFYDEVYSSLRAGLGYESTVFQTALVKAVSFERRHRNRNDSYFVLAPQAIDPAHCVRASLPLTPDDTIVLLSDGAARGHSLLGLSAPDAALREFAQGDPVKMLQAIRTAEFADFTGQGFPRGTRHDDATIVCLRQLDRLLNLADRGTA
jgi:hypothetical protein